MPQPKTMRKPPRVVFSLGVPMPTERRATRMAKKAKVTRNAYIVAALEEKLARDEAQLDSAVDSAAA